MASTQVIETENLTKYYGKSGDNRRQFKPQRGEIFGFIGPNGAGKTTTIRLLLNFIFPTEGRASVFGMDVETQPEIKRQTGYLPGLPTTANSGVGTSWSTPPVLRERLFEAGPRAGGYPRTRP